MPLPVWMLLGFAAWTALLLLSTAARHPSSAILRERFLQVGELFARQQANRTQRREVFLGVRDIAHHQVRLADVFVGAAVARLQLDRALVVPEGGVELLQVAVRIAEVIL